MGIAYSPPDRVIHADIDATSADCLVAGIHTVVQKAGWEVLETLDHGYVYLLTSPQESTMQMKVKIEDTHRYATGMPQTINTGTGNCIDITFLSTDEEFQSNAFALGYRSPSDAILFGRDPRRVRLHVTPCQIFTYLPGSVEPGSHVMGGIPFIDPNALDGAEHCADEENALKTGRAWWACGDIVTSDYIAGVVTFRTGWFPFANATLHNAEFTLQNISYGDTDLSQLRLVPANKPVMFFTSYGGNNLSYPVMMRWLGTEEPLCFDPLVAWNTSHPVKIRGQIWDAFVRTKHVPPEDPLALDGFNWFAYSSNATEGYPSPHWYQTTDISTVYLRDTRLIRLECGEEIPETGGANYVY